MVAAFPLVQNPKIPPAVLKPLSSVFFSEVPLVAHEINCISESVCPVIPPATDPYTLLFVTVLPSILVGPPAVCPTIPPAI